ncbi:hypothetical protein OS493_012766 [Desmophyllum pertusum]|uniref:Uncharacterized protein n=1 Tax=Desmophyllum pertusum TaxID=174260 RepID=A0A9W9ZHB2_9CNID|nr:hypothetical protein OS493_012766 [Desmophyllum pertusum]
MKQDRSVKWPQVLDKHAIEETRDSTTNAGENQTAQSPVSKPVAFDIALGQTDQLSTLTQHRPPRRLKKIESAPTLTRANLEQKQAAADQNRQKELDKKVKVVSKRRSELLIAREMDKAQQQKTEIEEKLSASERKRENAKNEVIAKQRQREEKAKRVRSKAKQMKDGDDVVDFDVDRDDTYNADEEDESWDADTPKSHSISSNLNDGNNNQKPGDREQATPPLQNSEPTTDNQLNRNEVHDFFDS